MDKATINRKEFLAFVAGAAGMSSASCSLSTAGAADDAARASKKPPANSNDARAAAFSNRVVEDVGRALLGGLSYLGDRLGLFKALAKKNESSAESLAQATGCDPRLVQEWLRAMVAAQYVDYDSQTEQYRLPPERAAVLADEESPFFMGGMLETIVPQIMATHHVMDAFRTGRPITPDVFHVDFWEGIERSSTPLYKHQLVQKWLPTMPQVVRRLEAGGRAADVGCGAGRALITIAQAFPNAKVYGYDPYGPSIERASEQARLANVADRATFVVGGARDLPPGRFDLISAFFVVHHMAEPVEDFTAIRRALAPNGSFLIMEDNISANAMENRKPWGVFAYSASTLCCLHDSMAGNGAGLGTVAEPKARQLAQQAGFRRFRQLPVEDSSVALYELKA